jgi:hypothetical protein
MRPALLAVVFLGALAGCGPREGIGSSQSQHITHPATEQPAGSLDALFAEIVRTDWQTEGQWEGATPKPPPDFVAKVREQASFRRVDLDGDGNDERIICLNYSPGQKPGNQTFYIARKTENGWVMVGKIEGEPKTETGTPRSGMRPLDATWYDGSFEYTTTRYEFKDGSYVARASKRWRPEE